MGMNSTHPSRINMCGLVKVKSSSNLAYVSITQAIVNLFYQGKHNGPTPLKKY